MFMNISRYYILVWIYTLSWPIVYDSLYLLFVFQTTLQLTVRQLLSNDNPQEYSDGYRFKETVKTFGLESELVSINIKLCILVSMNQKYFVFVLLLVSFQWKCT